MALIFLVGDSAGGEEPCAGARSTNLQLKVFRGFHVASAASTSLLQQFQVASAACFSRFSGNGVTEMRFAGVRPGVTDHHLGTVADRRHHVQLPRVWCKPKRGTDHGGHGQEPGGVCGVITLL